MAKKEVQQEDVYKRQEDMRGVADLVCDLNQYCGAAVTNGTFDMKQAMEG